MSSLARIEELEKKYAESPRRFFAPLANEFRKSGDPSRAIELCRAHLEQQPNHMSGQVVLGQALFDAGLKGEARSAFEVALTLDPENLIALRHLGDMARETGDLNAARNWYKQVLDVDSRNHEVITVLREIDEIITAQAFDTPHPEQSSEAPNANQSISDRWAEAPVAESSVAEASAPVAEAATEQSNSTATVPPSLDPVQVEEFWSAAEELPEEVQSAAHAVPLTVDSPVFPSVSGHEPESMLEEFAAADAMQDAEPDPDAGTDRAMPPTQWLDLPADPAPAAQPEESATPEVAAQVEYPAVEEPAVEEFAVAEAVVEETANVEQEVWAPSLADTMTYNIDAETSENSEPVSADDVVAPLEVETSPELSIAPSTEDESAYVAPSWMASSFTEELEEKTDLVLTSPEEDDALAWEAEMHAVDASAEEEADDEFSAHDESEWLPGLNAAESQPFSSAVIEDPIEEEAAPEESTAEDEVVAEEFAVAEVASQEAEPLEWQVPEPAPVFAQADDDADLDLVDPPADDYGDQEPVTPAPAVFITETMAQLYEQQGYLEMAAAVYRQLLEKNPESERLQKRVDDLEKRVATRGDSPRDRRAIASDENDSARGFFSSLVQVPLRPRLARPYVSGRVDAIPLQPTGNSDVGAPAREDPSDLSLETVFKNGTGQAGVAGSTGFSFDNFFTNEKRGVKNTPQPEREPRSRKRRGEDAEEIEQFNSWLEGLKRS